MDCSGRAGNVAVIQEKVGHMLVITRKVGQEIWIGDDIRITVREVRGRQVRIAISAPDGLTIIRPDSMPVDRTSELMSMQLPKASATLFPRTPSVPQLSPVQMTLPEDLPPAADILAARAPRIRRSSRRPPRLL